MPTLFFDALGNVVASEASAVLRLELTPVVPSGGNNIVFDGDSLTSVGVYPSRVLSLLPDGWVMSNMAQAGWTALATLSTIHAVDALYDQTRTNYYVLLTGTNTLAREEERAGLYQTIKEICQGRTARGFRVLVVTVPPRSDAGLLSSFETDRASVNALLLATAVDEGWAVAVVNEDANIGEFEASDNTLYYADHIHCTQAGSWVRGNGVFNALAGVANLDPLQPMASLAIVAPTSVASGSPFTLTVSAKDAEGETTKGYGGQVYFTTEDYTDVLPLDDVLILGGGTKGFSVTLTTEGERVITVTDVLTGIHGDATIIVGPPATNDVLLDDTFQGGAEPLEEHAPTIGGPWLGLHGIITGDGLCTHSDHANGFCAYVSDCHASDVRITLHWTGSPVFAGVVLRALDANNYWCVFTNGALYLCQVVNGSLTVKASVPFSGTPTEITASVTGNVFTATIAGATLTFTDSGFAAASQHGIFGAARPAGEVSTRFLSVVVESA